MQIRGFYEIPEEYLHRLEKMFDDLELKFDRRVDFTIVLEENGKIIGTASRVGNILKLFAISPEYRGNNLTSVLITELKKEGMQSGISNFALLTKPKNYSMFAAAGFHPISQTKEVLFMEDQRNGLENWFSRIYQPKEHLDSVAAIVMNGDPFTLGHYELVSRAAKESQLVYLFVLSEEKGTFSSQARLDMAKAATKDFPNVFVYPTGYYMISSATFPDYFLKKESNPLKINCSLDVKVFTEHLAKRLGINKRYVGEEPFCTVTQQYNAYLEEMLPKVGISLVKIRRTERDGSPISASYVRTLIEEQKWEQMKKLVPKVVYEQYLQGNRENYDKRRM